MAKSAVTDEGRKTGRFQKLKHKFLTSEVIIDIPDSNPLYEALEKGLGELNDADRRLIDNKYFDGFSVREIAQECNQTEKAIESRLGRIRKKVKYFMNSVKSNNNE